MFPKILRISRGRGCLNQIALFARLLDGGEVLLGRRKIFGVQILCPLAEGQGKWTAALRCRRRILRLQILQGGKIRLRRRQIPPTASTGQEVSELLKSILCTLGVEKAAAGNARNRHGDCLLKERGCSSELIRFYRQFLTGLASPIPSGRAGEMPSPLKLPRIRLSTLSNT
jgi:hypothetical protein